MTGVRGKGKADDRAAAWLRRGGGGGRPPPPPRRSPSATAVGRCRPRGVTRAAPWSTGSVPLRAGAALVATATVFPQCRTPERATHVPWVSIVRWWAMIQGSSAGVADAHDRPPVQLRPLPSSGGDLPPLRPWPALLRPGLRPGGAAGGGARGRNTVSTQPPRSHEPRSPPASLPDPATESDASGFTAPRPQCFTAP